MENEKTPLSTIQHSCNYSSESSELTACVTPQTPMTFARKTTTTSLPWHINLIHKIISNKTEVFAIKQKRITGVLQKLEAHHQAWLEEVAMDPQLPFHCFSLIEGLTKARPFFGKGRREEHVSSAEEDSGWDGASPYFSEGLNDTLCVCLRSAIPHHGSAAALTTLLRGAVELELVELSALQHITHQLTRRELPPGPSAADAVEVLWLLSLAVKRCKLPPPSLNSLLCGLSGAKLTPREALHVFSALVRFRDRSTNEVFEILTRRAVVDVGAYTTRDVVFALQAITLLDNSNIAYARASLQRCAELAPKMSAKEIGDVSKYLALLHSGRKYNSIAEGCAKELREALPAIAACAEELLGSFTLRDARNVLKCLTVHKVRHAILFSRLTPFVLDD
ncbi:unnamed protein product [Phytomonas sp. Hart1]|nr:unnamed protein product [Phytomonas sp. Hart1]|eukprot:CCW67164.1 unnamed protein product [Phytomonas sp. isolate Hart1]